MGTLVSRGLEAARPWVVCLAPSAGLLAWHSGSRHRVKGLAPRCLGGASVTHSAGHGRAGRGPVIGETYLELCGQGQGSTRLGGRAGSRSGCPPRVRWGEVWALPKGQSPWLGHLQPRSLQESPGSYELPEPAGSLTSRGRDAVTREELGACFEPASPRLTLGSREDCVHRLVAPSACIGC